MNFPTANLLPHDQIYPMKGVYAVNIVINQNKFNGIANFGERPTVDGKKLLLEVHLFDFNENIFIIDGGAHVREINQILNIIPII